MKPLLRQLGARPIGACGECWPRPGLPTSLLALLLSSSPIRSCIHPLRVKLRRLVARVSRSAARCLKTLRFASCQALVGTQEPITVRVTRSGCVREAGGLCGHTGAAFTARPSQDGRQQRSSGWQRRPAGSTPALPCGRACRHGWQALLTAAAAAAAAVGALRRRRHLQMRRPGLPAARRRHELRASWLRQQRTSLVVLLPGRCPSPTPCLLDTRRPRWGSSFDM